MRMSAAFQSMQLTLQRRTLAAKVVHILQEQSANHLNHHNIYRKKHIYNFHLNSRRRYRKASDGCSIAPR